MAIAVLFLAAMTLKAAYEAPEIRRPVCRFMYFYQEAEKSESFGLWERIVFSVLLAKSSTPSSS